MYTKSETAQPTVLAAQRGQYAVASVSTEFQNYSRLIQLAKSIGSEYDIALPFIHVTPLAEIEALEDGAENVRYCLYLLTVTSHA